MQLLQCALVTNSIVILLISIRGLLTI